MRRAIAVLAALSVVAALHAVPAGAHTTLFPTRAGGPGWLAAPRAAAGCPEEADPARFASADDIYADDAKEASYGARPTGSPNHRRFVNWIDARLHELPGATVDSIAYPIDRWTQRRVALRVRDAAGHAQRLPTAGPIPYSRATGRAGAAAPLLYVPAGTPIGAVDVRGRIVVRDAVTTKVPKAAITALSWWTYDPGLVLTRDVGGSYEREDAGQSRVDDLLAAGKGGAAGLITVQGFPREQVDGQYAPYEGIQWPVPAVFVGADEGARVKELAAHGGSARITLEARVKRVFTRMLIATLPGLSDEKILVQSHTDGMNGLWDNGPVAMLSMARWFARIGQECRPRTIQFAFTTGHLYQHFVAPDRDGSAEQLAKRIDREYDDGKVALVLPLEHMGARAWDPVARGEGRPGRVLKPSKLDEATSVFIGDSPVLIAATLRAVAEHDLRETIALQGLDLPGLQLPPHDNFGGEGNPYQHHLIPVVALVTAPWTLFDPGFTLEQLVDKRLLYRQTLTFTDLVHETATIPKELLGGGYLAERGVRSLTCATALEVLGLVRHCNGPPG